MKSRWINMPPRLLLCRPLHLPQSYLPAHKGYLDPSHPYHGVRHQHQSRCPLRLHRQPLHHRPGSWQGLSPGFREIPLRRPKHNLPNRSTPRPSVEVLPRRYHLQEEIQSSCSAGLTRETNLMVRTPAQGAKPGIASETGSRCYV